MPVHLSFLDDAVDRFEHAFALHQSIVEAGEGQNLIAVTNCARDLYLALEKGFKDAVAKHDPYLLFAKLDRTTMLAIHRDVAARPVPSIFCSRHPFDTVGMVEAWDTLRTLKTPRLRDGILGEFERSIKLLRDARNRAQHGELFEDVDTLLKTIELVLARFLEVGDAMVPDWIDRLCARNGQLRSRLKGIENEIDASWQVLVDYLRTRGTFRLPSKLYVEIEHQADKASFLLGGDSSQSSRILSGTDVALDNALGIFSLFLTEQQAEDRYAARQARGLGPPDGRPAYLGEPALPLMPMDAGSLHVPAASAWLTLVLPNVLPARLLLNTILLDLRVIVSAADPEGTASAILACAVAKGTVEPERIALNGSAYLVSEWHMPETPTATPPARELITRSWTIEWGLTLEPAEVAGERA